MEPSLIDTDILSMFLRGRKPISQCFDTYLQEYPQINFSIITYYEIASGLEYKDAKRQLERFTEFVQYNNMLLLTRQSANISAEIYARLRKQGNLIDDIDLLIAGIALENNLSVVTHNTQHFKRIDGLAVTDWSEAYKA